MLSYHGFNPSALQGRTLLLRGCLLILNGILLYITVRSNAKLEGQSMANGTVVAICIGHSAGAPMKKVQEIEAIVGQGLAGDRYARGEGSFNKGRQGKRQVTLINALFVDGSGFDYTQTRRNIAVRDIELMDQIGQEFRIDGVLMRGVKYCDPCMRPTKLSGNPKPFRDLFHDRGGLVAEIIKGGIIKVGSIVVPRTKDY